MESFIEQAVEIALDAIIGVFLVDLMSRALLGFSVIRHLASLLDRLKGNNKKDKDNEEND